MAYISKVTKGGTDYKFRSDTTVNNKTQDANGNITLGANDIEYNNGVSVKVALDGVSGNYEEKGKATVSGVSYNLAIQTLAITDSGVTTTYNVLVANGGA